MKPMHLSKGDDVMKINMMTVLLVIFGCTTAAMATSIQDRDAYVPSSDLHLGDWGTGYNGDEGYAITQAFQINLLYQPGILNADVEAFNDYNYPGAMNFDDNNKYFLQVATAGGLSAVGYDVGATHGGSPQGGDYQWTLTGWNQTIFAGSLVDYGGTVLLLVDPTQGYRSFETDPPVNNVEVFGGVIKSEVVAYRFTGTMNQLSDLVGGSGNGPLDVTLEVERAPVPEPMTMLAFGSAVAGLGGYIRRRRRA
jgi:hypothetical protein